MKKLLAAMLAILMMVSFAAVSGAESKFDGPRMEISIFGWDLEYSFSDDGSADAMREYVEDRFNITIKPISVGWDGSAQTLAETWAFAGTLPDVVSAQDMWWSATFRQWVDDEIIRPIPASIYSKYPSLNAVMTADDVMGLNVNGENYFFPHASYSDPKWWCMDRGILNRKDWREALGFDIPKTKQDFIDLCVAYATMDPKGDGSYTTGLTFGKYVFMDSQVLASFGWTNNMYPMLSESGELVIPTLEESALPAFSFLREMNKAGGLDPDVFTYVTENDGIEAFVSGKAGMLGTQVTPKFIYDKVGNDFRAVTGVTDLLDALEILDPPNDTGLNPVAFTTGTFWSEAYVNANVSDEKLDRICALYDFLLSEEGMMLLYCGFEGQDWERVDGAIKLLNTDPETGEGVLAGSKYTFAAGGMTYLASWYADFDYSKPTYPANLLEYCAEVREHRIRDWDFPVIDFRLNGMDVPERAAMTALDTYWVPFVNDLTDTDDMTAFKALQAEWDAGGYAAAKAAMTEKAKELGYID